MLRLKTLLHHRFGYLSMLIVAISGFILGNYFYSLAHATRPNPELIELRDAKRSLSNELTKSEFSLKLEQETAKEMNDTVLRLQSELLEQQLALRFYQKIMAPELTTNGVHIEKVIIEPGLSDRHYRFELIVAQLEKRKRHLKGQATVTFIGSAQGKPKQYEMVVLTNDTDALKLSFRYFQHIKTDFTLPIDFIPEKLKVKIKMPVRRGQKAGQVEQEHNWSELLKVLPKPILAQ